MDINEPVHVPSADPDHDGWLLAVVDRQIAEDAYESELWIVDGGDIGKGPVARVKIPLRLHTQVHGWWVSAAELARSREQA